MSNSDFTTNRMLSIDVLRGMTICFMIIVNTPGSWAFVWAPLKHAEWHGCTPTDLVFPAFLFVIGLSMAFSLSPGLSQDAKSVMRKVVRRTGMIFLVGLLLNWFPFYHKHISDLRIFGVLQRIALAYLLSGLLISALNDKKKIGIVAGLLLLVHWGALLAFGGSDPFSLEGNIGRNIDLWLFGESHVYKGFGIPFDPEGLLGTLSSAAQIMVGFLFCQLLLYRKAATLHMVRGTLLTSLVFLLVGYAWGTVYPINKPLWTGSYALYTSGIVGLLLGVLIWVIDLKKQHGWTYPFRVFGLNPLVSFVLSIVLVKIMLYVLKFESGNLYFLIYTELFQPLFGNYLGSFLFAVTIALLVWTFAWMLYRKGRIIKL